MPSISVPTAILGAGALGGAASVFSGIEGSSAAQSAAQIQANAADQAAGLQYSMFQQTTANLSPWMQAGQTALNALLPQVLPGGALTQTPSLWGSNVTSGFQPTMASLAQTPGYQFSLQQGLQATNNAYAANGLAGSITGKQASPTGPLAAAQTQFATGLASNTFNQQYQNWLAGIQTQLSTNLQNYNLLGGVSGSGQNAAANLGSLGLNTTTQANNALLGGAAASAAGQVGAANALTGASTGISSSASNTALMLALNNSGIFGQTNPATAQIPLGSNQ